MKLVPSRLYVLTTILTLLLLTFGINAQDSLRFPYEVGSSFTWDILEAREYGADIRVSDGINVFSMSELVYELKVLRIPERGFVEIWTANDRHDYMEITLETPDGQLIDDGQNYDIVEFLNPSVVEIGGNMQPWYDATSEDQNTISSTYRAESYSISHRITTVNTSGYYHSLTTHKDVDTGIIYYIESNEIISIPTMEANNRYTIQMLGYNVKTFSLSPSILEQHIDINEDQEASPLDEVLRGDQDENQGIINALIIGSIFLLGYIVWRNRHSLNGTNHVRVNRRRNRDYKNPYEPYTMKRVRKLLRERRCCKMAGRLGDRYCDMCGRIVPQDFIVTSDLLH